MYLHEKSNGILETYVTWSDVEQHLQETFNTKAKFGENRSAVNISDMKGFMSRIALVEADWQNVEDGKDLPNRFIVKIASQLALFNLTKVIIYDENNDFAEKIKKLAWMTRECHNREVAAYKILMGFSHPDIPYTKIHALKSFDDENDLKGYIIAAYIPNVHSVGMHESIPADELIPVVRGIGTFAGLGQSLSSEEKKHFGGPEFIELMFKEFFDGPNLEKMFESLRKVLSETHSEQVEKLIEIYWVYFRLVHKYSKIKELLGFELVPTHGDMWQANFLHSRDNDGKLKLEAIIDWQGLSLMPPGLDNSRLLMGSLSTQDRRTRGKELLKVYHDCFVSAHGKEVFSFEELFDSYNLYFPTMAMIIQPGMMSFLDAIELSEPEKSVVRQKTMEKIIGLMEDVFVAHEYNLTKFPNFMSESSN